MDWLWSCVFFVWFAFILGFCYVFLGFKVLFWLFCCFFLALGFCYVFLLQGSVLSVLFHRLYYLSVCETERSKIEAPLLSGVANHGSVNTSTTNAPIKNRTN